MKKGTILWADDDPDDLMLMRQILDNDDKYDIVEATNGREALDYLQNIPRGEKLPCLIILDMNMPVLNGRETLRILKDDERLRNVPVVVFTTSNSELDKMYCKKFDVEMVTKPPSYNQLREVVTRLLSFCSPD